MLKSVRLENFKSARDLEIPLAPLTVLSGLNGSGKSSVFHSIAVVKQSIAGDSCKAIKEMHLRGPLVQLGQARDVKSEQAKSDVIAIEIGADSALMRFAANALDPLKDALQVEVAGNDPDSILRYLNTCWFQYIQADRISPRTHYDINFLGNEENQFLGTHGEFTAHFLAMKGEDLVVEDKRHAPPLVDRSGFSGSSPLPYQAATPRLNDQIAGWLQHISPGVKFSASRLDGTDLAALRFSYVSAVLAAGNSNARRPSNVGYGLTYSLPVVTALLAAPRNSLLLIENPEAHLHPRGQAAMGTLLAKACGSGVQILVETHSDHILNGIRIAIKNSKNDLASQVRICNFTRDVKSGDSYIETPRILPNGDLTAWPDGFFDEWERSLEQLLK